MRSLAGGGFLRGKWSVMNEEFDRGGGCQGGGIVTGVAVI